MAFFPPTVHRTIIIITHLMSITNEMDESTAAPPEMTVSGAAGSKAAAANVAAQPPAAKKRKLSSIFKKAKSTHSDKTLTVEERVKAEVEAYCST